MSGSHDNYIIVRDHPRRVEDKSNNAMNVLHHERNDPKQFIKNLPEKSWEAMKSSQGSGDVSNRSEIHMNIWYHGWVATYSEYQKTTIRKYLTKNEGRPHLVHTKLPLWLSNPRSNIF